MMTEIQPLGPATRTLTATEFRHLADVPPEAQWFANLTSTQTRRAYQKDLAGFMRFTGIVQPEEFRAVTRSHVLAWRTDLEKQALSGATVRRRLAALEDKTPALGEARARARALLNAPLGDTLKGKRDRAILAVLLFHALRREELTKLCVKDFAQERRGCRTCACRARAANCASFPHTPAPCTW